MVGDRILLTCKVSGGSPAPKVVWKEGHSLLDDVIERARLQTVANTLMIERVTRKDLNRVISCVAKNTRLMAPLQQTVTVDMICKLHCSLCMYYRLYYTVCLSFIYIELFSRLLSILSYITNGYKGR